MGTASNQLILLTYKSLYNKTQAQVCTFAQEVTQVTKQISNLTTDVANKKMDLREEKECGQINDAEYERSLGSIVDAYAATLQDLQNWETGVEMKKDDAEQQAAVYSSYIQSYQNTLGNNINSEFKFGGSS